MGVIHGTMWGSRSLTGVPLVCGILRLYMREVIYQRIDYRKRMNATNDGTKRYVP